KAAGQLRAESLDELTAVNTTVILCGVQSQSLLGAAIAKLIEPPSKLRKFALLDEAIEWAEDQIIYRYGGYGRLHDPTTLPEQQLLGGLTTAEIEALATHMKPRTCQAGQRIVGAGEPAMSLVFLQSRMVRVKLPTGVPLATFVAGIVFGEMALLEDRRSADVWADTLVHCHELPLDAYAGFRDRYPQVGERIIRNLAVLLAKRLILANTKIDLLTS